MKNFKEIIGLSGYFVSDDGVVKSMKFNKSIIMKQKLDKGYYRINLCHKGKKIMFNTHRLVLEAFTSNPLNLPQVNHINGIKTDNRVENLEWCEASFNQKHAYRLGLSLPNNGEKHGMHKLTDKEVQEIRELKTIMSGIDIAKKFNISRSRVSEICNNKAWKHI